MTALHLFFHLVLKCAGTSHIVKLNLAQHPAVSQLSQEDCVCNKDIAGRRPRKQQRTGLGFALGNRVAGIGPWAIPLLGNTGGSGNSADSQAKHSVRSCSEWRSYQLMGQLETKAIGNR